MIVSLGGTIMVVAVFVLAMLRAHWRS